MASAALSRSQIANKLGISERTLGRLLSRVPDLTCNRLGNRITFDRPEVDKIMKWVRENTHIMPPIMDWHPDLLSEDAIAAQAHPIRFCCVYFLLRDGKIVYVGQSSNVWARLASHRADKTFDSWCAFQCEQQCALEIESNYIDKFKPEYNLARPYVGEL